VPRFLSPEWIDALDRAARADKGLRAAAPGDDLILEQVVTGSPDGERAYHLIVSPDRAGVAAGRHPDASVTITVPFETAIAINAGDASAQAAFMTGQLRLGGDVSALLRHRDALAGLDDLFAAVRAETTY
jgi:hypothetical protein